MNHRIKIGCIADDFTGASDAASFIVKGGMKTVLFNGIPKQAACVDAEAIVIALKTRTADTSEAVKESLDAVDYLMRMGTEHIYSKYCSTFDSTPKGNIGPILDALLEKYSVPCSILCPALPVNGRIVRNGFLYVNGVLLSESPMKNHPLTPMWDSDLAVLMETQSSYPCVKVTRSQLEQNKDTVWEYIRERAAGHGHYYIIPDYEDEQDARRIAAVFGDTKILSGGSGLLTELARCYKDESQPDHQISSRSTGRAIILAGSCSEATRKQIDTYKKSGKYSYKLDPFQLINGEVTADSIWKTMIKEANDDDILIYSSDSPERVKKIQEMGKEKAAGMIERALSEVAVIAMKEHCNRMIAAGGETSGAITKALGFETYMIGESIAPGVPIMIPVANQNIRLILKSGNFGNENFFMDALQKTKA